MTNEPVPVETVLIESNDEYDLYIVIRTDTGEIIGTNQTYHVIE